MRTSYSYITPLRRYLSWYLGGAGAYNTIFKIELLVKIILSKNLNKKNVLETFWNVVAVRLNSFLELHSIIYPNQFGFRSGSSTTHALISITQAINRTIEDKQYGCGVFIDLKKALDTVRPTLSGTDTLNE